MGVARRFRTVPRTVICMAAAANIKSQIHPMTLEKAVLACAIVVLLALGVASSMSPASCGRNEHQCLAQMFASAEARSCNGCCVASHTA